MTAIISLHPDDPGKLQAFAYGNGFIRALIRAVNAEITAGLSDVESRASA